MKIVWIVLAIVAIVLISRKSKSVKIDKGDNDGTNQGDENPEVKINKNQAKKVFLLNIDKFAPILPSLNNDSFDCKLWTEVIVTVNDFHLTELWKKYVSATEVKERWKRLLASWQIKSDNCKSSTLIHSFDHIFNGLLQFSKFPINLYSYCLKNSFCWVSFFFLKFDWN